MNKNQLYDIENELYRELDTIKSEQKQYNAGVEKGIDMTISAIRKELGEENQPNNEEQPNNCIYCTFKDGCGDYFPNADEFRLVHCDEDDSYTISASLREKYSLEDIIFILRAARIKANTLMYCKDCLDQEETDNLLIDESGLPF